MNFGSGGGAGVGSNLSRALGGTGAGGDEMVALLTETRGAPLARELLESVVSEGWEVREVERGPSGMRYTASACVLRGTRSYLLDRALQPDPDPSRLLSRHASACPVGYRGSSLRNWCCRGGWSDGLDAGVGVSFASNDTQGGCDCAVTAPGLFPGGRGGGVVRIRADGRVKILGRVSAEGESTFCNGDTRTELPRRQSFSLGGGGAGGSLSIEAMTIEGTGSVSASGGQAVADCPVTRSGGGGAGGRVALVTTVRDSDSVRRPVDDRLDVQSAGGNSDGCSAGAAGTIWYGWNGTLSIHNRRGSGDAVDSSTMPSAFTPIPSTASTGRVTGGGGGDGGAWRWNSSELDIVVEGGASLLWAREEGMIQVAVRHLWVTDRSFVSADPSMTEPSSANISARSLTISNGAVLGCLPCARSVDAQNGLPGCRIAAGEASGEPLQSQRGIVHCPPVAAVAVEDLRVVSGGQVLAVMLNVSAGRQFVVDASSKISTPDYVTDSDLAIEAPLVQIAGLVHASSIQVRGMEVLVTQMGELSSEAMGSGGGLGPSAGESHNMGGGGGGHGGRGAQGCHLSASGGDALVTDDVAGPWRFGSGGGHGGGNSKSRGGRGGGAHKNSSGKPHSRRESDSRWC